jgi:hypothetical protein
VAHSSPVVGLSGAVQRLAAYSFGADITTTEVAPPFALFKGWEPPSPTRPTISSSNQPVTLGCAKTTWAGGPSFRADITTTEVAPPFALFKGWEPRTLAR